MFVIMCSSPNSRLVNHTINLNYANKKKSKSLKWIVVNSTLLLVFVYDLSCKCPGYTSVLHYVELLCVAVFTANLVQYALWLVPSRVQPVYLSRDQQKLLGLSDTDLDSSFIVSNGSEVKALVNTSSVEEWSVSDAELSLSPRPPARDAPPSPHTPPSPHSPHTPPSPHSPHSSPTSKLDTSQDYFIADRNSLAAYLKRTRAAEAAASAAEEAAASARAPGPPPPYRVAPLSDGSGKSEEESPQSSPELWWRLDIDPQRVTQWNLNLRLWLHATIVSRVARELERAEAAGEPLPASVLPFLAAACGAPAPTSAPAPAALQYAARRVRELAGAPCLSGYRWDGGGAGWGAALPTDAELLLGLLAAYVDSQLPPGARRFAERHLAGGGAGGVGAGDEPVIVRVAGRPAAWALAWRGARLAPARGRDNLLHVLLLLLAAAARRRPPALDTLHLGPAGLNMLWIIGR